MAPNCSDYTFPTTASGAGSIIKKDYDGTTANFADKNAGTGKSILMTLGDTDAGNYQGTATALAAMRYAWCNRVPLPR